MSSALIIAVLTAIIGIAIIAFIFLNNMNVTKGKKILLLGEIGAGKTVLYHQLKDQTFVSSVTSLSINQDSFVPKALSNIEQAKEWIYVDLPGHGSFRSSLPSLLLDARAIVYVIDATNDVQWMTIGQNVYALLTDSRLAKQRIPLIFAVNKTDKPNALSVAKVTIALESVLEKIRKAKSGTTELENIGGVSDGVVSIPLTKDDSPFTFTSDKANLQVSFVCVSAKEGNISSLTNELIKLTK